MKTSPIAAHFRAQFRQRADALALVDCAKGRRFTYAQLEDLSSRVAAQFAATAGRPERVLLLLGNQVEMIVSYLACMQLGVTSVPVNPAFAAAELRSLLSLAGPSLIVTDQARAAKLPTEVPAPVWRWQAGDSGAGPSLAALERGPRLAAGAFPSLQDDDLTHLVFTSGSTGTPKAIPIRLGRIIGHAAMFAKAHALGPSCRFYNVLPLAYLGGWYNLALVPLLAGGGVALDAEFGMSGIYRYWATALAHDVNCIWLTPSMVAALTAAGAEAAQRQEIRSRIRWAMVGMAPLAVSLKRRFEDLFEIRLQQSYGLSETLLFTSWMSDTSLPDDSVGKVLPGYEVKIDGGEILVRGAALMDEYWGQPALTAASFDAQGFFRTGDVGHLDANGCLRITGRVKDLIIRGGVNISPGEIEEVILRLGGVREAAVVGMADELYGEKVVAFVATSAAGLTAPEVLRHCRACLSAAKVPAAIHFVAAMPLNASGKIDKAALRRRLAGGA